MQGTDERLDRRPPDRVVLGIPLGLQVDAVQTQGVLPDDAVDAAVADLAGVLDGARDGFVDAASVPAGRVGGDRVSFDALSL